MCLHRFWASDFFKKGKFFDKILFVRGVAKVELETVVRHESGALSKQFSTGTVFL